MCKINSYCFNQQQRQRKWRSSPPLSHPHPSSSLNTHTHTHSNNGGEGEVKGDMLVALLEGALVWLQLQVPALQQLLILLCLWPTVRGGGEEEGGGI